MDYFKWAEEYYYQADEIQIKIDEYQNLLKKCKLTNRYMINEKIKNLKSRHIELMHTANDLRKKALRIQEKEIRQGQIAEEVRLSIARFLQEQKNDT